MEMNYKEYHLSGFQKAGVAMETLLVTAGISYLFYQSLWGMLLSPIVYFVIGKNKKKAKKENRQQQIHSQFMDFLKILNTCLMSGMSMENAWREATVEIALMHGKKSLFFRELEAMNGRIASNVPMEEVVLEFAYRTGVEDLIQFAEIFEYGKKSGANWRKLIGDLTIRMEETYETEQQIEVLLTEKRLEQRIMSVIPLGMILFLQLSSGDYIRVLYGNLIGGICMTICLLGYVMALFLAEKIMKIQV